MSENGDKLHVVDCRTFRRSESIAAIAAALSKAQGEMEGAKKDSANPFFKSKYADLASVRDASQAQLSKHGLAIVQFPRATAEGIEVETLLCHSSGEWFSETLSLPVAKNDAQGIGSAITYARRYAWASVCGIAPEDDDGNAAVKGLTDLRDKTMAILERCASEGSKALEQGWKSLGNDARKACQSELPRLKAVAQKVQPVEV